jgi:hypothetical protein
MLTDDHKTKRMGAALNFLVRYHDEGDEFLNHIVTGDETWISHVTPDNKQQSMQWQHSASRKAKKFKQTLSARKIMCTAFWDRRGVLLIDFMTQGTAINADVRLKASYGGLFKTKDEACSALEFFRFTTTHGNTLLLEHAKCSNCSGKSSNTHPIAPTLHPVTFTFSST